MIQFNQAITVACLGLFINIVSVFLLRDSHHHHDHHGHDHDHHDHSTHHHEDQTLKAAYLHVLADALTSVTAIVALVAGKYLGWIWMDAAMGIVGSVLISRWAYGLLKQTSKPLLDEDPYYRRLDEIAEKLRGTETVELIDFHCWQLSPQHRAAIVSIASDEPQAPEIYQQRLAAAGFHFSHFTVEVVAR